MRDRLLEAKDYEDWREWSRALDVYQRLAHDDMAKWGLKDLFVEERIRRLLQPAVDAGLSSSQRQAERG